MRTSPTLVQFAVIRRDGDWQVLRDGVDAGQFDFSVDAIEAALIRAGTLIDKGEPAQDFVQDDKGQLRQVDPIGGEVLNQAPQPAAAVSARWTEASQGSGGFFALRKRQSRSTRLVMPTS